MFILNSDEVPWGLDAHIIDFGSMPTFGKHGCFCLRLSTSYHNREIPCLILFILAYSTGMKYMALFYVYVHKVEFASDKVWCLWAFQI